HRCRITRLRTRLLKFRGAPPESGSQVGREKTRSPNPVPAGGGVAAGRGDSRLADPAVPPPDSARPGAVLLPAALVPGGGVDSGRLHPPLGDPPLARLAWNPAAQRPGPGPGALPVHRLVCEPEPFRVDVPPPREGGVLDSGRGFLPEG